MDLQEFPRLSNNSGITYLSKLDASVTNVKIKVRIIKLWRLPSYRVVNGTHAIEVILMDEEGSKIQATINGTYLIKHEKFLVEKSCVFIQRFDIGDNMSTYRVTNHPHRLFLTFDTTVTKCNEEVGSLYGLTLADFDILRNNGVPNDSVVDLIGYVHTYFDMYDYKTRGGKIKKKMNLQLKDLKARNIFVTLWESYAEQLNTFMANKREDVIAVIILQFGKYNFSGGSAYVSSCFQASNLFINDNTEEIISFRNSLLGNEGIQYVSTRRLVSSQLPCSLEIDFLSESVFSSIADVNKTTEAKSVVITGTIISFMPGVDWYYNACQTCNKKVKTVYVVSDPVDGSDMVEQKQIIKCPNESCNTGAVSTIPRFKIPLRLQDNTGVASLTVFDREARKILKKCARELLHNFIEDATSMIPPELSDLVGKKYAFKIEVTDYNIINNYKSFTIKKFTDDYSIISKLESKFEVDQVDMSQSATAKSLDFRSQETSTLKDTISSTSENDTPLSVTSTTHGKTILSDEAYVQKSSHSKVNLKRNLLDVYDVDEPPTESSSKARHQDNQGPKVYVKKLLTPKLEK